MNQNNNGDKDPKAKDSTLIDDIPKRYLIQVKRGISWSYRELELTNEVISYYKQENNELRFQGFIKDFELIQNKKNLLTLTPKNKQNNIEVKIWSDDCKQLLRIKHTFDYLLSKALTKNPSEGKKNIILDSSEDSKDSIHERLGSLPDNLELRGKNKQSRKSSCALEKKIRTVSNDSTHIKQMEFDLSESKDNNEEDREGNEVNEIHEEDDDKVEKDKGQSKVSNRFNSNIFNHDSLRKYFDLSMEKNEIYHNICYTKHSIIDINSESNDKLTFLILMNDSFIDSINMLKTEAIELSKDKESIYNGTHIIFLLSLVMIILSISYVINNPFLSYLIAFTIGGLAYVFYYKKCLNQPYKALIGIKDPQFDYNFIQNDKRIIRISSFFNERLDVLMRKLANDEQLIDKSYSYLISRKDDGTLIYQSNLFDSNEKCEFKLIKENNWKEDSRDVREIIINEYVNDNILRTICFEEKELEGNCFMTKATIYLRISAMFNQSIPITFVKDTLHILDKIQSLLMIVD